MGILGTVILWAFAVIGFAAVVLFIIDTKFGGDEESDEIDDDDYDDPEYTLDDYSADESAM